MLQHNKQLAPDKILELGFGFWGSKTLLSAVELGLFTELALHQSDANTLAQRLGLHTRGVRDFLDALVAMNLLERDGELYANTPETDLFLDRSKPSYIGGILEMANLRLYHFWGSLTEALRTGQPQNEIKHGGNLFETIYSNQASLKLFLESMTGISLGTALSIAQKFPWQNYQTFADIGTAQGGLSVQLALQHKHLKGIGYDLSVVRPIFEEYIASFNLSEQLQFQEGDFFQDALPGVDVLIMGHILHDWNFDQKQMLIAKAYEALPTNGVLIVYEALIDDERRQNVFGLLMSLNMLVETEGGFDYTGSDCSTWMHQAGFRETYVERLVGSDSMVVGIK